MNEKIFVSLLSLAFVGFSCSKLDESKLRDGDIIFQTSLSNQSEAIQSATHSKYSHCGIIFHQNNELFVLEAVQPVMKTELKTWIKRGKDQKYVVKRLKNSEKILSQNALAKMRKAGLAMIGKNYDLTFEWSDKRIYCSELIWKIYYAGTGLKVGRLQKLKEFDLTNPTVNRIIAKRYGNKIPYNEPVISPQAIFESELLETIDKN